MVDKRRRKQGNHDPDHASEGLRAMRERSRAVAEREASRLARPDQRASTRALGPATGAQKSSTPFGEMFAGRGLGKGAGPGEAEAEEWCGPFSVARQMIAAREDARRLREAQQAEDEAGESKERHPLDQATAIALERKRRLENPSLNWVSRQRRGDDGGGAAHGSYYTQRRTRVNRQKNLLGKGLGHVPTLFRMCVNYLVENFEHIETLGLIDHSIRRALCERLVAQGKMDGAAFSVLAEMGVETLELVDCAQVTQDQFCAALRVLLPAGLRAILLKHCGRCFARQAVQVVVNAERQKLELFAISLAGAYLLTDEDLATLVGAASRTLSSIDLTACPLASTQFCQSLGEHFSSNVECGVNGCLLELALQSIPLTKEALLSLGASSDALRNLKSLKLKEIEAVDDEVVSVVLASIEGGLEGIDLTDNPQLTDDILSSIRRCNVNGNLRALQLSGLKNLTRSGLEAFFTPIEGLPPPPMLRKIDLSHCSHNEVTDAVVVLAAKAASFKRSATCSAAVEDAPNPEHLVTEVSGAQKGLVHVNIAGSSVLDKALETLAATCSASLEELDVSFCASISDKGLGYLVSKLGRQFAKLHVWGLAQLTDEFLDGHDRLEDGGLEIVGVWMKKSGGRSLR